MKPLSRLVMLLAAGASLVIGLAVAGDPSEASSRRVQQKDEFTDLPGVTTPEDELKARQRLHDRIAPRPHRPQWRALPCPRLCLPRRAFPL